MMQRFVRESDLDNVYSAIAEAVATENPSKWKLKAYKYYIPAGPIGLPQADTKFGAFTRALYDQAVSKGWIVASIKRAIGSAFLRSTPKISVNVPPGT